ncbi:MAG: ribonuclease HII [Nitrospinae bacterium]|nr:ribonuclease HII [Nitrospinota bacterium]
MMEFERKARESGYAAVAGVDEAGRGPLAGPVVAAAVILPEGLAIEGLTDSKMLAEKKREELFTVIMERAVSHAVAVVEAETIDRLNILEATRLAMLQAVEALSPAPGIALIDGNQKIAWRGAQWAIVKGDARSLTIAAASVLAKVTRDRIMVELAGRHPEYGFERHKGYGCAEHLAAIAACGPCPIHRKTFRGVREHLPQSDPMADRQRRLVL